jgi:general stress protein 26
MNAMKKKLTLTGICSLLLFSAIIPLRLYSQSAVNRDTIIIAAHEIINETSYCGLVTIDSTGQPKVRTMNPFPVKDDFVIWFATSRTSRKVKEIKSNSKVCVYFANHSAAKGYVTVNGAAEVIDDKDMLIKMRRDYWESIPNWQNNFVLLKIVPKTMEVINYKHGLNNDPNTFKAPTVEF